MQSVQSALVSSVPATETGWQNSLVKRGAGPFPEAYSHVHSVLSEHDYGSLSMMHGSAVTVGVVPAGTFHLQYPSGKHSHTQVWMFQYGSVHVVSVGATESATGHDDVGGTTGSFVLSSTGLTGTTVVGGVLTEQSQLQETRSQTGELHSVGGAPLSGQPDFHMQSVVEQSCSLLV